MATRHSNLFKNYTQLNTIPAIVGIVFAVSAAVQFLQAEIMLGLIDYSFDPAHALIVSVFALVVAFASSDTKNFQHYETWEQALVGLAVVVMVSAEYTTTGADFLVENEPHAGLLAFLVSMAAWGVLAR